MAAVGGAGIPQGSLVTITVVLTAVGLPLESVSLVLAVDWIMYEQLFFVLGIRLWLRRIS